MAVEQAERAAREQPGSGDGVARRLEAPAATRDGQGTADARPGDPCVMVIFGGTGDLTKRKLIPALYNLAATNLLSKRFAVVGLGRTPWTTEEFRQRMAIAIQEFATQDVEPALWDDFVRRLYY